MEVNIYINIDFKGHLSKGTGIYCIILEYIASNGEPATLEIYGGLTNTSKNRTALKACVVALKRLKKPCFVNLYINSTYVTETMIQEWYFKWNFADWTNQGKPVKNADLWQQLFTYLEKSKVKFVFEEINTYTSYFESKLKHMTISYQEDRKGSI